MQALADAICAMYGLQLSSRICDIAFQRKSSESQAEHQNLVRQCSMEYMQGKRVAALLESVFFALLIYWF